MKRLKTTSQSLIASLIVHGLILFVIGTYLVTKTQPFQDFIDGSLVKTPDPPKPKVRKPMVIPITKPVVPTQSTITTEQVQSQPRVLTAVNLKTAEVTTEQVIEFPNRQIKLQANPQPHQPTIVTPDQPIPDVVTYAEFPTSDAPGTSVFSPPTPNAGGRLAQSTQRGISGGALDVQSANIPPTVGIQSLLDTDLNYTRCA